MNIHDQARRMVQQSPRPMALSEAYSALARRGAERRRITRENRERDRARIRVLYSD